MRLTDLLAPESISLNDGPQEKGQALRHLVALLEAGGALADGALFLRDIWAREDKGNTGVGKGMAVPHAKSAAALRPALSAAVVRGGVEYGAPDRRPVTLLFMIAVPAEADALHLRVLSRLAALLHDGGWRGQLLRARDNAAFLDILARAEAAIEAGGGQRTGEEGPRVLAVTACPTGIAHTYLAARSLESAARALHIPLKVETNGAQGTENRLTPQEIAGAACIVVAADRQVEMARFAGKPLLQVSAGEAIRDAQGLLLRAVGGEVAPYHPPGGEAGTPPDPPEPAPPRGGRRPGLAVYKYLMNGVSHMLPFVIAGGLLTALSFLLDDYSLGPASFGQNRALPAFLNAVGQYAMGCMLPVLSGFIAMGIADKPGLAVGVLGGLLARDGPVFAFLHAGKDAGGSGFLGAILAGFLAGWLVLGLQRLLRWMPAPLHGIRSMVLYPFLGILLLGLLMVFVITPPVALCNRLLLLALGSMGEGSRLLLGALLGGMMAVDMGGPINKVAYMFATASLAQGDAHLIAAVMLGGMVPPLATALCTLLFKSRFTHQERQLGLGNFVLGLAFITEGAIPFAATDPLRVIPACVAGSAVAGGLSMLLGCTLPAPHGGVFVLPVAGRPLSCLLALACGCLAGALLLALLKLPCRASRAEGGGAPGGG